jgi:hypothetical protein
MDKAKPPRALVQLRDATRVRHYRLRSEETNRCAVEKKTSGRT